VGGFNNAHDINTIVKVANILKHKKNFIFKLYGDGYNKTAMIQLAKDLNLKNIFFYNYVNKNKIPNILKNSSMGGGEISYSRHEYFFIYGWRGNFP
jgi:hypothetical protein